jgi:hypothetical protein
MSITELLGMRATRGRKGEKESKREKETDIVT